MYFFVEKPNPSPGGQTPLSDFRQVWRDLPAGLREKLLQRGLLYKRRYFNEQLGSVDPLQHKSWQAMFMTDNQSRVEEVAATQGFTASWDAGDNLLLTHPAVVKRTHESTGEEYWNTHLNVLHAATASAPLAYSAQILDRRLALIPYFYLSWLMYVRHDLLGYPYGSDMVYADDQSALSFEEAMSIRRLIYKNTWISDWHAGDVLILDNHRIAHGRMPYFSGDRKVYVAWQ
ncbi:hypothetical protein EON64_09760 [archaeon]|nr:MAG: hypothetical protein EON64_09760 [archaeon]